MIYNIRNGAIRWKIPDFLSDVNSNVCIFLQLLLVKKALEKIDLEIRGQAHDVQHSQWHHSMANA